MWVHRVARVVFGGMLLHVGLLARDFGSCCIAVKRCALNWIQDDAVCLL